MATSLQAKGPQGIPIDLRATPDGQLIVNVGEVDCELLPTRYTCKQAWEGVLVGHVIRQTVALDVASEVMTVVSVMWENESTNAVITAPPNVSAYLTPLMQGDSLTLAQLLSAGMATANNQVAAIGYLADLADGNDRWAAYKLVQTEDLGGGTKYVLKSDGAGWLLIRKTYTDTTSTTTYAGNGNNPAVPLSGAWAARNDLVYGSIGAAP